MALKYYDDWQSSKKSVLQRNACMFDNELMSDVSFTCGESNRVFHAHKYVLATSSFVFYAMFYGDLAHKASPVHLEDAEDEEFEEFLRFLYTDDCKLTAENAIRVLYLAKKYLISPLVDKCCEVLKDCLQPENVFTVIEQAVKFGENDLEAKCWDIVVNNTVECINSVAFSDITLETLNTLLRKQTLAIQEVELFKRVLTWVNHECARQGIDITNDKNARRRVLGNSVYEINFLEMSQKDFGKYVSSSGVLTDAEIISIFQTFIGLVVPGCKWDGQGKRRSLRPVSFARFDIRKIWCDWKYDGIKPCAINLRVNKAVFIQGVRMFGDQNGSQYELKLTIQGQNVTGRYTSEQDDGGIWGYDVMLPKPLRTKPNEEFTIAATIKGPQSRAGNCGNTSVKVNDTVVTFSNAPSGSSPNGTSASQGQFYKIFLYI